MYCKIYINYGGARLIAWFTQYQAKVTFPRRGWLQGWEQGGKYMYNTSKLLFSMSTLYRDHVLTMLRYNFE
jgi:hypothetical protein